MSIEFSNKEVIIDSGQRGFQGVIRSGSQIAVGWRVNGRRGSQACLYRQIKMWGSGKGSVGL